MGHAHVHGEGHDHPRVPLQVRRWLLGALLPFVLATVIGLILLWPDGREVNVQGPGVPDERFGARVTDVSEAPCPDIPGQESFECSLVRVEVSEGPDDGHEFSFDYSNAPNTRAIHEGDRVVVAKSTETVPGQEGPNYYFVDFDRNVPLLMLGLLFAAVVVALSRWKGLAALAGLAVTLLILIKFVLPAILQGSSPLLVACVGGAAIMFLALYLAHGFNVSTTTAVLGTLASLLLTGLLATLFVEAARFTGSGSEEAAFLQITQQQVNLEGLLLGSIIIGTLGVLDDVTVTQASAVWELHRANPEYGIRNLYQAGIRIGRDHIASTVNTLVLAYAGASLPLMILFTLSNRAPGDVLTTEIVAEEIIRTGVGSIGLIASVPITTGLAAFVVTRSSSRPRPPRTPGKNADRAERKRRPPAKTFQVPRAEREWREQR